MKFSLSLWRGVLLAGSLALGGCLPTGQTQSEEEREPHFLAGKSHVNQMDYKGAIECFEKALEVNPQSASAHFELGCLYEQKEIDPAAAIYHYEHYLKLRPNAENNEIVKQQIMACKQELARTVSLGPITERQQREFERLAEEKQQLSEENRRLRDDLEKWQAYANRLQTLTNRAAVLPAPGRVVAAGSASPQVSARPVASELPGTGRLVALASLTPRTHTVKAGETPTVIARKYGIKVVALMAANPRVEARRLQVGQALSIPAP
jgi:tetratricopeptide (TPR) repeat protein